MMMRIVRLASVGVLVSGFFAVSASAGTSASITIDQVSGKSLGSWILLSANGSTRSTTDRGVNRISYSLGLTEFGPTTLSVSPPQGMSAKILVYRGGELVKTIDTPQYSFSLFPNDAYRFLVQYSASRLGSLGVTSNPSGIRFRLKGEGTRTYTAVTPHTFKNIPAGQYSVSLTATKGCLQPPAHSAVVVPEQRNTLMITLTCDQNQIASDAVRVRPTKRALTEYAEQREFNARGSRK